MEHPAVAEAGVIGKPDPMVGEPVKAFVTLKGGPRADEALRSSSSASPASAWARPWPRGDRVPATVAAAHRSGKIMRRLLKARELGLPEGDTSTLEAGA
jgi:acetyl-CoA synthetase